MSVILLSTLIINQKTFAQQTAVEKKEENKPFVETLDTVQKLEDLKALDYPELQVVPRASERLAMESAAVRDRGTMMLFPYMASSFMTLSSGLVVGASLRPEIIDKQRDDAIIATKFAIGVGAVGMGLAYWYTASDNYGTTLAQIRGFKNKDRRTELLKERLSEEAFEKSANLISQWKWVFAAVNLVASAQLTGKSTGDNNIVPSLSVAASILPLFITTSYETNYNKQLEYKRRIYVPLTWFDYGYNPTVTSWQPQLNAIWTF